MAQKLRMVRLPREINVVKPGFYARSFRQEELADLENFKDLDLEEEIRLLRVMMRRVLEALGECSDPQVLIDVLVALSLGASRIVALTRMQNTLREGDISSYLDHVFDKFIQNWEKSLSK